jgi:hypothetical protein
MPRLAAVLLLLVLLVACAGPQRPGVEAPPKGPQTAALGAATGVQADSAADPPHALVTDGSDKDAAEPGVDGTAEGADDGDPMLRRDIAERCANRPRGITETSLLRGLVADLDAEGVPPALAADALILGRCADLADIVTEVVARGGEDAAMPVIERAVALTGTTSALVVERAATEGLLRAGRERVAGASASPPLPETGADYAMVYFPLGGDAGVGETGAMSLAQLVGNAEPGYGIYTYILAGNGDAERLATYRELLRVIETYVLVAGNNQLAPDSAAHTFLVPVHAGQAAAPLVERAGTALSAAMREALATYLRRGGEGLLAARLATAPGPFLVSSLEPRLVPGHAQAPRLIVDLSAIGPEFMYSVVDAYDRRIPTEASGRIESLLAVRARLMGLLPEPAAGPDATPSAAGDWVVVLGRQASAQALPPAAGGPRQLAELDNGR